MSLVLLSLPGVFPTSPSPKLLPARISLELRESISLLCVLHFPITCRITTKLLAWNFTTWHLNLPASSPFISLLISSFLASPSSLGPSEHTVFSYAAVCSHTSSSPSLSFLVSPTGSAHPWSCHLPHEVSPDNVPPPQTWHFVVLYLYAPPCQTVSSLRTRIVFWSSLNPHA